MRKILPMRAGLIGHQIVSGNANVSASFAVTARGVVVAIGSASVSATAQGVGFEVPASGTVATLEADWLARSTAGGVVWGHDFRADAEVNAFRWQNGFGNDPNMLSTHGNNTIRITSDGITGGGCLQIERDAGSIDPPGWWRPFAPLAAPGNGKTASDPAANGTLTVRTWDGLTNANANANFKKGYYAHPDYDGAHSYGGSNWVADDFDGNEFWIQYQFKVSAGRFNSNFLNGFGKYGFIATTGTTLKQELVIQSCKARWLWYTNFGFSPDTGGSLGDGATNQPGGDYSSCQSSGAGCWLYKQDEWVTFLIHVIPGHEGVEDSRLEVFVARDGQINYETLYTDLNTLEYTQGPSVGHPRAYNAFQPSAYCNGSNSSTAWTQKYDQIIFSKDFIPCRQVYASGGSSALALACYALSSNQSATFTQQSLFTEADLSWQSAFYHDERHGVIRLMGKEAGLVTDWASQEYNISTNAWGNNFEQGMFSANGHIYGSMTMDHETGDVYCALGNLNGSGLMRAQRWTRSTDAWGFAPASGEMATPAVNDIPNGLVYHPHLWGRNDGGLVFENQVLTAFWRKNTGAVSHVTHATSLYGAYEGAGCYSPGLNAVFIGGGDGGQLLKVAPNSTIGGAPVLTAMGVPPVRVEGTTHGTPNIGSLHQHPSNPNKLILVSSNDQRCWTSTDGSTWTQIGNHPFTVFPRVVCSLRGGLGCLWSIGRVGSTHQSMLWRPPV